jgi:Spy/CpxP family protein refolding chaperone
MLRRILVVGLLGSALMFAQRGGGGGGGGRGGGGGMIPQGSFGPVNKLDRIADMFKLTKDQKKELKQTFDEAQKEAAPLHEQLSKARLAVGEAVVAGKPEEITKNTEAAGGLETQMTMIELKAFVKATTDLDPEQKQKAGGLFLMMHGLFSGKNWNSD